MNNSTVEQAGGGVVDDSISSKLRAIFLVHGVFAFGLGILLWSIPGRTLTALRWVPETFEVPGTMITAPGTIFVDPGLTRLLGAALIALAFSSYQAWRAYLWTEVILLVRLKLVFAVLGFFGILLGQVLLREDPSLSLLGWLLVLALGGFAIVWGVVLRKH